MDEVQVVVAHSERTTLRVGDMFVKIDGNARNLEIEAAAIQLAPVPTPEVLWHKPNVLALAAVPGTALGRLGEPSPASPEAWAAAGAAVRKLHEAPLPPWPAPSSERVTEWLDRECEWLIANEVLPAEVIVHNREIAELAFRPWEPVFAHGDLQITHIFTQGDEVTGIIDWSEASQGDPLNDLAVLTLGHEECLDDLLAGYGMDVDVEVIRALWSLRSLRASRWLIEHGFDPNEPGGEFDVLRARM
ncbi:phosphotransferase family protein [Kribbella sp. WER1]